MSNTMIDNEDTAIDTPGLRANDFAPTPAAVVSAKEVVATSKAAQQKIQYEALKAKIKPKVQGQIIAKDNVAIRPNTAVDFAKLTEDDVYNMDIPMEARPFSSEDSLKVELLDTGYVARWVNKNPQRLGQMLNHGFRYVHAEDLARALEVEVSPDAEGHFCLFDVVLMRIPKERYYSALRAAHLRAVNSVGSKGMHASAKTQAQKFVDKETGGGYSEEAAAGKIEFYSPGITIYHEVKKWRQI